MDWEARARVLEKENDELRERVENLMDALVGADPLPIEWGLTAQESIVACVIMNREMATKEAIMVALYGGRCDEGAEPKIVDVFVCKIRKKIERFGVNIQTVRGQGYCVDADTRAKYGRHRQSDAA